MHKVKKIENIDAERDENVSIPSIETYLFIGITSFFLNSTTNAIYTKVAAIIFLTSNFQIYFLRTRTTKIDWKNK